MLNKTFDSSREFAANRMAGMAPNFVRPFDSGAESFKAQLNGGYSNLFNKNIGGASAKASMGGRMDDVVMQGDSLTKY